MEEETLTRELDEVGFIKRPAKKAPQERPQLLCAADIEPLPVYWLWLPYIPMGMVTMISGDPGLGKSWMTMSLAADISAGRALPLSKRALPPRKVLVMNYEDSPEHTIVPRLLALGANMDNVHLPSRGFVLDADGVRLMEDWIREASVGLVFIDPIVAALGSDVDMNKANEVRAVMGALANVAHRTGTAIIAVRHLRKAGKGDGGKAIYAGLGSIDFTAAVRSELLVEKAKDGTKIVRHIKCNVGPLGPTLAYHYTSYETTDARGEPVQASRFEWLGPYDGVDDDQLAPVLAVKRAAAQDFLREFLAKGPVLAPDVFAAAEKKGFSAKTLKRAKDGVAESVKIDGFWHWQLIGGAPVEVDPAILAEAQRRLGMAA